MSKDECWGRVEDDRRHTDYMYDKKLFEQGLSKRTAEIFEGLKRRKQNIPAVALGLTNSTESNSQSESANGANHDAQSSVDRELAALIQDIIESDYIPKYLQTHWTKGLKIIGTHEAEIGQKCINDFKLAFVDWKKVNRPTQSIWDIGNTRISFYDCEMLLIECKVDRISWLLSSANNF